MRKLLNTLYVSTQGSYLRKEGETVVVEQETRKVLQLPIHTLGGIVCFGNVLCSPFLLGFCAEKDVSVSFMTEYGRFLAAVKGFVSGNVLLRREQYRKADDTDITKAVACNIIVAKVTNSRTVINRAIRDHGDKTDTVKLKNISRKLGKYIKQLEIVDTVDEVRGLEGISAALYFSVFDDLIIDSEGCPPHRSVATRRRLCPFVCYPAILSFSTS